MPPSYQGRARMPAPLSLDLRATIQELLECGMTHEAIADDLSIPRSTVTTLKRHIEKHGHIYPIADFIFIQHTRSGQTMIHNRIQLFS